MNKEELDRHRRLLIEKVKELQQENKQLKENNKSYQEEMARTWKKNDNLKSILTELEKWLNLEISIHNEDDTIDILYSCVLNKIQKLKEKYK